MTEEHEPDRLQIEGAVKWFDPVKGYGFVVSDMGGSDVLLHVNVLRNFGQSSIADGSRVTLVVQQTDRGIQAAEVVSITPPEDTITPIADIAGLDAQEISQTPLVAVRVKWFDKAKGFGFANVFGQSDDVFVHIDVLRQSGLADMQPGEALAMRVIDGKRGLMAAEVQAWETVTAPRDPFED
ncbi:cold-shock protein [Sulfitobacter sp. S190]|uniref:cold-shock protein n=1 Tax=Sulfitobacter sp. S190 TaxID=2867022 RepID=UPI0021A2C354|nr:cold shock domain-containing protein [Sulfitobacter sp. S190]UWR23777.1 cold shock domain-containing protein [Sulfitobacter sp. S190]